MTHEFKTPISTIAIASETISDSAIVSTPERLFTYAGIIHEEAGRLNRQVERVLQTAKAEMKEFKLSKEKINLHELIEIVTASFNVKTQNSKGEIILELNAEHPVIIADKQHLTNVVFNLVDNAFKYTEQAPIIKISTYNSGNVIVLDIKDNGIGIQKEYQKKIFDKFFRVPTGNVHNVKGFGLGLSYVKSIVTLHKWKIKLDSETGKGTTFIIEIPV